MDRDRRREARRLGRRQDNREIEENIREQIWARGVVYVGIGVLVLGFGVVDILFPYYSNLYWARFVELVFFIPEWILQYENAFVIVVAIAFGIPILFFAGYSAMGIAGYLKKGAGEKTSAWKRAYRHWVWDRNN